MLPGGAVLFAISDRDEALDLPSWVPPLMTVCFLLVWMVVVAAMVLAIRHLYVETTRSIRWKMTWTALIMLFNAFALPVYWLRHMSAASERWDA